MTELSRNGQALPENLPDDELRLMIQDSFSNDRALRISMTFVLSNYLLQIARRGNPHKLKIFVEEDFSLIFQHPETGASVLHILAAGGARKALRVILKSDKLDFLLRDKKGRLSSEMAYLYGRDVALSRLLGNKEGKQADEQGARLTRRPRADFS